MTKIAAAVCDSFCSFFETEVTSMFMRSSRLLSARSFDVSCDQAGIAITTAAAKLRQPRLRTLRIPDVSAASTGRSVLSSSGNLTLIVPLRGCAKLFQTVLSGFMPPTRFYFLFVNWSSEREQFAMRPSQRSLLSLSRYLRDKRRGSDRKSFGH